MPTVDSSTPPRAWQLDRELRLAAIPRDRRIHGSEWYTSETVFPTGDQLIAPFWNATGPGPGGPRRPEGGRAAGTPPLPLRRGRAP